ncbi:MAG: alpha/beta fold hydrolase [Planctomycetes bacterium]|nr:alpha/beta fold hydrolase [Planctomycetota bacterium]
MRRHFAVARLSGAIVVSLLCAESRVQAQATDPVEETFLTADGIQLHGLFHASSKNSATDAVVLLLYPPGKDNNMNKGDWKGLATTLSKEGYNVFRFDWRGHGKSTTITDPARFWNLQEPTDQFPPNPWSGPWNNSRLILNAPGPGVRKIKNDLFFKDLRNPLRYAPAYLLDLAAARHHLDTKNDNGSVNTSSIYLIGSDWAAALGLAWLVTEWNRPAFAPTPNQLAFQGPGGFPTHKYVPQPLAGGMPNELGGGDISGAVWLSAARPISFNERLVKSWISGTPKMRENNPMLFLYGAKDLKAEAQADFFVNEVLVVKPPPGSSLTKLDQTLQMEVKNGAGLNGVGLLGANTGAEDTILQYLDAIQKNRAKLIRKNRGFTAPWSIQLGPDNNLAGSGFGFRP